MNKKVMFYLLAILVSNSSIILKAQIDLQEAQIHITDLTEKVFTEGTNVFGSGNNRVKLSFHKEGTSNTFSIGQATGVTCDGMTNNSIVNLAYNQTYANDYAYIQIENTGTSNIVQIAIRGWCNTSNNMINYGYSTTTAEESNFITAMDGGFEDSPLMFHDHCDIAYTAFGNQQWLEAPDARYIRISSHPAFPNIGFSLFNNANVAIYGIYIQTDDPGIPSGIPGIPENKLQMVQEKHLLGFTYPVRQLAIYDATGKKVKSGENIRQISMQELPAGVYIIKAFSGKGENNITQRIIK